MHGLGNLNETKACHGHQFHPDSDNRCREAQNCLPKRNDKINKDLANVQKLHLFLQICSEDMCFPKEYEANQDQSDVDLVQILLLHFSILFI